MSSSPAQPQSRHESGHRRDQAEKGPSREAQLQNIEALREEFPAVQHFIYMNTGTSGPSPRPVNQTQIDWVERLAREGGGSRPSMEAHMELLERARQRWAEVLGASSPTEIALTHNTSEGIALVAAGLEWQPGDEVVVTGLEHISGLIPWAYLQRRHRIIVKHVPARPDGTLAVEDVAHVLSERTRLLCFSHVSYSTGARLPARELVELASRSGALTVIDGAQAVGHIPVDVQQLGCDFYAVPGQKWLLGPEGTGALYVRSDRISELHPPLLGWASTPVAPYEVEVAARGDDPLVHGDARRFEVATSPVVAVAGVEAAIRFVQALGPAAVWERIQHLASVCRRELAALPGVRVWGESDPGRFTGLVSFAMDEADPAAIVTYLYDEHRIVCRSIPDPACVRLSLHVFNTEEEIERVLAALRAYPRIS